jgi:hypothetical protein
LTIQSSAVGLGATSGGILGNNRILVGDPSPSDTTVGLMLPLSPFTWSLRLTVFATTYISTYPVLSAGATHSKRKVLSGLARLYAAYRRAKRPSLKQTLLAGFCSFPAHWGLLPKPERNCACMRVYSVPRSRKWSPHRFFRGCTDRALRCQKGRRFTKVSRIVADATVSLQVSIPVWCSGLAKVREFGNATRIARKNEE